jgi:hypothetical protein
MGGRGNIKTMLKGIKSLFKRREGKSSSLDPGKAPRRSSTQRRLGGRPWRTSTGVWRSGFALASRAKKNGRHFFSARQVFKTLFKRRGRGKSSSADPMEVPPRGSTHLQLGGKPRRTSTGVGRSGFAFLSRAKNWLKNRFLARHKGFQRRERGEHLSSDPGTLRRSTHLRLGGPPRTRLGVWRRIFAQLSRAKNWLDQFLPSNNWINEFLARHHRFISVLFWTLFILSVVLTII